MDRRKFLEEAIRVCCLDRQDKYGEPENSFAVIARFWSEYLKKDITSKDVAILMALLKISREMTGVSKEDNFVDGAAYLAIAGELGLSGVTATRDASNVELGVQLPLESSSIYKIKEDDEEVLLRRERYFNNWYSRSHQLYDRYK